MTNYNEHIETMCRRCINHAECGGTGCRPKQELTELAERSKAMELVIDWAIDCDFGYDNLPEDYMEYLKNPWDFGYKEGLIRIADTVIKKRGVNKDEI